MRRSSLRARRALAGIVIVAGVVACRESVAPLPVPVSIEILSGDQQETVTAAGSQQFIGAGYLAEPLRVRVTDRSGAPVRSARVTWTTTGGSFFVSPSAPGTYYPETASLTDSTGIAQLYWTWYSPQTWYVAPGTYTATVVLPGTDSVTFTGYARTGPMFTELRIAPDTVNVAAGAASATVMMRVTDDRTAATPFEYAWVNIGWPAAAPTEAFTMRLDRVSGEPTSAEFRGVLSLSESTQPGDWKIVHAAAGWGCGAWNRLEVWGEGLDSLGFPLLLHVKNAPLADVTSTRFGDDESAPRSATTLPAGC